MQRFVSDAGFPSGVWCSGASPFVALDTSWRQYHDGLAAKHRANLRNRFKRLNQFGAAALETAVEPESLPEALDAGLRLKSLHGSAKLAPRFRATQTYGDFMRPSPAALRFEAGCALTSCVSAQSGSRSTIRWHIEIKSFSSNWVMIRSSQRIRHPTFFWPRPWENAFEQGLTKYDFLGENAPWKSSWTETSRSNYWLFLFSRSFKGRCLHFLKFRAIPRLKSLMGWQKKETEA